MKSNVHSQMKTLKTSQKYLSCFFPVILIGNHGAVKMQALLGSKKAAYKRILNKYVKAYFKSQNSGCIKKTSEFLGRLETVGKCGSEIQYPHFLWLTD